ncbi:MAG: phosphatidylserine decarboxylase, partial [Pseudohongiellaceae bacterium]
MSRLFILLQYLVPHHGLSRLTGRLAESTWASRWLIRWFIRRYRVDMSEAVIQDPAEFDNFNAFFTRAL